MSNWCSLRVYAEAEGPVVALILITHSRTGTDLSEIDMPYILWNSIGTRATAALVARFYRWHNPETARRLGSRSVQRTIASLLHQHRTECFDN